MSDTNTSNPPIKVPRPAQLDPSRVYLPIMEADAPFGEMEADAVPADASKKSTPPPPKVGTVAKLPPKRSDIPKPTALDPASIYGTVGEKTPPQPQSKPKATPIKLPSVGVPPVEKPAIPELFTTEVYVPKVKPVQLDPAAVYAQVGEVKTEKMEDIKIPKVAVPKVKPPSRPMSEVAKPDSSDGDVEVLGPENKDDSRSNNQLSTATTQSVSKWAFWKRPSKRDQQLARISEGYVEMVDLVRAMRNQLESQNENNIILRDSLAHLPAAVDGLQNFSKSQQSVGDALEKIHGQMTRYTEKDEKLANSMNDFNDTLKGMDDTSKASIKTFDRVQERMRDSDIRMENLFQNVQASEEKVSETMVRLQRNMGIMQIFFLVCLLGAVCALIVTVMKKNADEEKPVEKPKQEEVSVTNPATSGGSTPVRSPRTIGE